MIRFHRSDVIKTPKFVKFINMITTLQLFNDLIVQDTLN